MYMCIPNFVRSTALLVLFTQAEKHTCTFIVHVVSVCLLWSSTMNHITFTYWKQICIMCNLYTYMYSVCVYIIGASFTKKISGTLSYF